MRRLVLCACVFLPAGPSFASSNGANWDHDGAPGRPDCTACHFDAEPLRQSERLELSGVPDEIVPGKTYELSVRLSDPALVVAGFLIAAQADGADVGEFEPLDSRTEANGASLRSTKDGSRPTAQGEAEWKFLWRAPAGKVPSVSFHVSANAANGDASPFGDAVYLSKFTRG